MMELHEYERPIAVLALQQAEINRDRKKKRRPHTLEEFYLYKTTQDQDLPHGKYGSSALRLIELGKFPSWALFVYNDLVKNAEDYPVPSEPAFIADNAIILAPEIEENIGIGMLIALQSASGCLVEFRNLDGDTINIWLPKLESQVNAIEGCEFRVLC